MIYDYSKSEVLSDVDGRLCGHMSFLGTARMGKSSTMYKVIVACPDLYARAKAFNRVPNVLINSLPSDFNAYRVERTSEVRPGDLLINEDANRIFPARGSGVDKDLPYFMATSSHDDILVASTFQSSAGVDFALFNYQDNIVFHKWMNPTALQFEREEFRQPCATANRRIMQAFNHLKVKGQPVRLSDISYVTPYNKILILEEFPDWLDMGISKSLRGERYRMREADTCKELTS